jgi:aldehyde dehydrogenase (NAD+)
VAQLVIDAGGEAIGIDADVRVEADMERLVATTVEKFGRVDVMFYLGPDAPFGGYGISGDGVEHGIDGFREYLRIKTIASPAS